MLTNNRSNFLQRLMQGEELELPFIAINTITLGLLASKR